MAENIKLNVKEEEEEEEEEDEGSVIDIRHRRFVYKVRSVQAPDHPATSFHMTPQNTSSPSANSSDVMKMEDASSMAQTTDSNEYFDNESLLPRNAELLALSAISDTQQNSMPLIAYDETKQFPSFETDPNMLKYGNEHHSEQIRNNFNEPIQPLNAPYEGQFSDGTTSHGKRIIMGLTNDGQVIVVGLSMPINKKLSNIDGRNIPTQLNASLSMSQISEGLNEQQQHQQQQQHEGVKRAASSNKIVTGLTAHGDLIIANIADNCPRVATHQVSVIMGLTSSGQIICGGCACDTILGSVQTQCEKIIESDEHHAAVLSIIGNLTAESEKVVIGLANSNFKNVCNGSLFRRDSF
uniref:AT-hook motif nuclear-localized protein n=1 Tax=Elaeophora elaphi TaxID=1147741 RepID=A0A0R3S5Z8_9BILA